MDATRHLLVGSIRGTREMMGGDIVIKKEKRGNQVFDKIYQRDPQSMLTKGLFRLWDRIVGNVNLNVCLEEGGPGYGCDPETMPKLQNTLLNIRQTLDYKGNNSSRDRLKLGHGKYSDARSDICAIVGISPELDRLENWSMAVSADYFPPGKLKELLIPHMLSKEINLPLEDLDLLEAAFHKDAGQTLSHANNDQLKRILKELIASQYRGPHADEVRRILRSLQAVVG